ncbi:sensor histidine kinase [Profundibacterium mesophilum]|uniref:histidine kinase n=1 Tax=Profundibacterium mesophilum KAUST100406-0324 TaxID=1037889 RepID=A0A921NTS7_9RHOB|nr:HAMP domain-containing sensor histidine kinase [Profundibacterium mesophilum]KAF0675408.1 two-component system OmpR family phosphate regulon sensor histidine kinase PhoR [Profundibacterium mesophilum KAUST100406-0324]
MEFVHTQNRFLKASLAFAVTSLMGMMLGLVLLSDRMSHLHNSALQEMGPPLDDLDYALSAFSGALARSSLERLDHEGLLSQLRHLEDIYANAALRAAPPPGGHGKVGIDATMLASIGTAVEQARFVLDQPPRAGAITTLGEVFHLLARSVHRRLDAASALRSREIHGAHAMMITTSRRLTAIGLIATFGSLLLTALFARQAVREKRLRREKTQLLQSAQAASLAKDEFIAVISHELRTPLTSIKGALSLAGSGTLGKLEAPLTEVLNIARRNADRLTRMVNDLLDIEKARSGRISMECRPMDLGAVIAAAVQDNADFAAARGVRFSYDPPAAQVRVNGDAQRLSQVAFNLMSNAAKFSPDNSTVRVAIETSGGRAVLKVIDEGIGIAPEFHDRVFDRFSQADSSDTRTFGGSGLGLNISKVIVEQHGGRIWFDSTLGEGTVFSVELGLLFGGEHERPQMRLAARHGTPAIAA